MSKFDHRSNGRSRTKPFAIPLVVLCLVLLFSWAQAEGPGKYVGQETCLECHDTVAEVAFEFTAHGMSDISGWDGAAGCESCHGPGEAHSDSGGEIELILSVTRLEPEAVSKMCLSCHEGDVAAHWQSGSHDAFDATCVDCHTVHEKRTMASSAVNKNTSETCLSCHMDMRKHLYQRSRHPLKEGLMSCVSCHDPHGSPAIASISAITPNDKCYQCHAEQRGPFLFPHQPVAEDCTTCHNPHGSNQASMLEPAPPRLCQSCHLFGHHQTVPGTPRQAWNVNRSCVNCHSRIHGSNHPSGVMFMR